MRFLLSVLAVGIPAAAWCAPVTIETTYVIEQQCMVPVSTFQCVDVNLRVPIQFVLDDQTFVPLSITAALPVFSNPFGAPTHFADGNASIDGEGSRFRSDLSLSLWDRYAATTCDQGICTERYWSTGFSLHDAFTSWPSLGPQPPATIDDVVFWLTGNATDLTTVRPAPTLRLTYLSEAYVAVYDDGLSLTYLPGSLEYSGHIPEPSLLALMGLGLAFARRRLLGRRRRN